LPEDKAIANGTTAILRRAQTFREFIDPYPVAFIYVGERDEAIKSLEKAYEERSTWVPWTNVKPKFLRCTPIPGSRICCGDYA
jgi:hypothetical protein